MENNVILSQKMDKLCFAVFPIGLPILAIIQGPLFRCTYITNRGVKPNIKYLALSIFKRNTDTPVQIPCHCSWLQPSIDPAHALSDNLIAPISWIVLLNTVKLSLLQPLLQPLFMILHGQIPVLCFLQHRDLSRNG